jgi:hypothetical protein
MLRSMWKLTQTKRGRESVGHYLKFMDMGMERVSHSWAGSVIGYPSPMEWRWVLKDSVQQCNVCAGALIWGNLALYATTPFSLVDCTQLLLERGYDFTMGSIRHRVFDTEGVTNWPRDCLAYVKVSWSWAILFWFCFLLDMFGFKGSVWPPAKHMLTLYIADVGVRWDYTFKCALWGWGGNEKILPGAW